MGKTLGYPIIAEQESRVERCKNARIHRYNDESTDR